METKTIKLIRDAQHSDRHNVARDGDRVRVATGKRGPAITIYGDGSIVRADVRLDVATRMTANQARELLGL